MSSIREHGNNKVPSFRECIRSPIRKALIILAKFSAKRPFFTVFTTIVASCTLFAYGLRTNYHFETKFKNLWIPPNSFTQTTEKWIFYNDLKNNRESINVVVPSKKKVPKNTNDATNAKDTSNTNSTSNTNNRRTTIAADTNTTHNNDTIDVADTTTKHDGTTKVAIASSSTTTRKPVYVPQIFSVLLHKNGEDVATVEGMERAFEVANRIQGLEGYRDVCGNDGRSCRIAGPSGFWDDYDDYRNANLRTDARVKKALSSFIDRDGELVWRDMIFGDSRPAVSSEDLSRFTKKEMKRSAMTRLKGTIHETARNVLNVFKNTNMVELYKVGLGRAQNEFELTFVKSFVFVVEIPKTAAGVAFVNRAIASVLELRDEWDNGDDNFDLSVISNAAIDEELIRSVMEDAPLLAAAFLIMIVYCCFSLSKCHRIQSRSLLGVGAVVSVFMSLVAGFGILFIYGMSLTPLSYLLPFGLLGLGLDDTFILTGAFERTDPKKNVVDRVVDTVNEVGLSIFVTTLTTVVAYSFGSISSLPGVKWFCIYAAVCVTLIFFYQITFFVACIVLDDRRRTAQRLDCLICFKSSRTNSVEDDEIIDATIAEVENEEQRKQDSPLGNGNGNNTFMSTYTRLLLKPISKVVVLTLFTSVFVGFAYIASGMTQEFDLKETLVKDSFVRDFMTDLEEYTDQAQILQASVRVVFRNVDVSNATVQSAMRKYVDDLVDMPYISNQPMAFWLNDFDEFLYYHSTLRTDTEKTFNEKLDIFLNTPPYDSIYASQMRRDKNGKVLSSWTYLTYDQVSLNDGSDLVNAFRDQQRVTASQPINQVNAFRDRQRVTASQPINPDAPEGPLDSHFFNSGPMYFNCEMWAVLVEEVTETLIIGLVTLFIIALVFIPHYIAALILTPTVFAIFVEVIAVMRLAGLHFDPFTSIGLITCLGFVMDYNLHVFQAYLELEGCSTRNERVTKMMESMGRSVMQCGLTNLLGVLPLAFNSSLAYRTIFISFLSFTTIGVAHGLIFLPVVLSLVGPINSKENAKKRSVVKIGTGEGSSTTDSVSSNSGKSKAGKEYKDDLSLDGLDV